jgi:hypothetical protein
MSIQITWQPSTDLDIQNYLLERAVLLSGPWHQVSSIPHTIPGPNWDSAHFVFYYNDMSGNAATYYRLTAVDRAGQSSPTSAPFRSTTAVPVGTPGLVTTLSIPAGNVSELLTLGYYTIEIWRSADDGATWNELTAPLALGAAIYSDLFRNTMRIGGLSFSVQVDGGTTTTISFPGEILQNWTTSQVVLRINEVVPGLASVRGMTVRLMSPSTGRASSLTIVSDQTGMFGAVSVHGLDQRILLASGVMLYRYYDEVPATPGARYRWRFSADGEAPYSNFFDYSTGQKKPLLDTSLMSVATAIFTDLSGRAVQRSVVMTAVGAPTFKNGLVIGAERSRVYESDGDGFLQVELVRGTTVRVGIEGTNVVREFVVPDVPTFDLLQIMSTLSDRFDVQSTLPIINRRHV